MRPSRRLVQIQDHIWEPVMRASGECFCPICCREYYDHPMERTLLFMGQPYLTVLCTGERVKL